MMEAVRSRSVFAPWRARNLLSAFVVDCVRPVSQLISTISLILGRTLDIEGKQSPFGDRSICQSKVAVMLRPVLRPSLGAHLLHAEDVLDHVKRVLDPRAHACRDLLDLFQHSAHRSWPRPALASTHRDFPLNRAVAVYARFGSGARMAHR